MQTAVAMWIGCWRLLGGSLLCGAGYVLFCSLTFDWGSGADVGTGSHLYNAALMAGAAVFLLAGWAVLNWSGRGWAIWVVAAGLVAALSWQLATAGSESHRLGPSLALGAIGGAVLLAVAGFAIASIPTVRQGLGAARDAWRSVEKTTLMTEFEFKGGGSASTNEYINGPSGFTAFLIGCYMLAIYVINPGPTFGMFLGLTFPLSAWLVEGAAHRHVFETSHMRSWPDQWVAALKWWSAVVLVVAGMAAFSTASPQWVDEVLAHFGPDLPGETGDTTGGPDLEPVPPDASFTSSLLPVSLDGAHGVLRLRGRPGKKALLTLSFRGLPFLPLNQRYVIWSITDKRVGTPVTHFLPRERGAFNARCTLPSYYLEFAKGSPGIEITRTTHRAVVARSRRAWDEQLEPLGPVVMRGRWHLDE